LTPFEAYLKYLALKMHFSSSYDYVKYQGKVSAKIESFTKRNDRYHFYKLSKRDNLERFLVANLFVNDKIWVGQLLDEEATNRYLEFEKRQNSLSYMFKSEIKQIDDLNEWIKTESDYPKLYSAYKRGKVSPETMIILNGLLNIFPYWDRNIEDTVLYPEVITKLNKLSAFIKYDKSKYKEILKQNFS